MIREYSYRCRDRSILTPYLKKYLVNPLMVVIPITIPANVITIFSNLFVYFSLGMAYLFGGEAKWNFILIPVALVFYVVGDHIDGMQAKRTKTSSALGEFCDHFLDTFNNGIILVILFLLFDLENNYLLTFLLALSYLAHAGVFFHQFKTGWLVFEKLGSLEAMAIIIAVILSSAIPGVYNIFITEIYGLKLIEYVLIVSCLGAAVTFLKSIIDAAGISRLHLLFIILWIIFSSLIAQVETPFMIYCALILYGSTYIGSLMHGHLVNGKEPFPDVISVAMLGVMVLANLEADFAFFLLLFLIIKTSFIMFRTFYSLREYWVWVNPKLD